MPSARDIVTTSPSSYNNPKRWHGFQLLSPEGGKPHLHSVVSAYNCLWKANPLIFSNFVSASFTHEFRNPTLIPTTNDHVAAYESSFTGEETMARGSSVQLLRKVHLRKRWRDGFEVVGMRHSWARTRLFGRAGYSSCAFSFQIVNLAFILPSK